jgi:hypothetical protein
VGDVEHRNLAVGDPHAQVVHDLRLRAGIERRERFVEQQRARLGDERAGKRDALLLAAGKLRRAAAQCVLDAKCRGDGTDFGTALGCMEPADAVGDVRFRAEMGKQREVLKDQSDAAVCNLNVNGGSGVVQRVAADCDAPSIGLDKPGEAFQQRRLA